MNEVIVFGKKLCMWCESEAITTVNQIPSCAAHENEYRRRRESGESFVVINQDFWRRRWAEEDARRSVK